MNMVSVPALARFDLINTVSEAQARGLRGRLPNHRIDAVPHGVDVDFFCPPGRRKQRLADAPFRLLAVGHWLRDYPLAIAAIELLIARGFSIDYRIVSHNLDLDIVPGFVTHLTGLTDQQLLAEYRAADLLFMPLTDATANNALLECMASGTAVVTTDVGAVSEYVSNLCGKTAKPDAHACADAVEALLQDRHHRARSGANARKQAQLFDWRRIAERHDSIYRSLLVQTVDASYGT
jgi:glycosyltransferase involved in cell wall biosynthesis